LFLGGQTVKDDSKATMAVIWKVAIHILIISSVVGFLRLLPQVDGSIFCKLGIEPFVLYSSQIIIYNQAVISQMILHKLSNWKCYCSRTNFFLTDPVTKAFLTKNIDPVFGYPQLVRFSWSTAGKILQEHCAIVEW